ncbi:MAG: N-acetyltransferase [Hyphomicrobium sp.]
MNSHSPKTPAPQTSVITRAATNGDTTAIADLQARVFGPGRFARTAYRVREGTGAYSRFCHVADFNGRLIASLRMTEIAIGGRQGAAMLGPIAVDPDFRGRGHGRQLIREALDDAKAAGLSIVILVGDLPYYQHSGFKPVPLGSITFPGPVNPARILAVELAEGAAANYRGLVTPASPPSAAGGGKGCCNG